VASLSQGRTAAAQCGLFTYKSVPVIFEPPCIFVIEGGKTVFYLRRLQILYSVTQHTDFSEVNFTLNFRKAQRYNRECNFIHTQKINMAFHAPIFRNFTKSEVINTLICRYLLKNCVQSDNKYWEREQIYLFKK